MSTVGPKICAFGSPLLIHDLLDTRNEAKSASGEYEEMFSQILQEKGEYNIAHIKNLLAFKLDQRVQADPSDQDSFASVFVRWWKPTKGETSPRV